MDIYGDKMIKRIINWFKGKSVESVEKVETEAPKTYTGFIPSVPPPKKYFPPARNYTKVTNLQPKSAPAQSSSSDTTINDVVLGAALISMYSSDDSPKSSDCGCSGSCQSDSSSYNDSSSSYSSDSSSSGFSGSDF